jgi:pre-rRNA-processing protein TSR1
LAERVEWKKNADDESGTLVIEGVVRGARLDANRLVHLQSFGDFKIDKVCLRRGGVGGRSVDLTAF